MSCFCASPSREEDDRSHEAAAVSRPAATDAFDGCGSTIAAMPRSDSATPIHPQADWNISARFILYLLPAGHAAKPFLDHAPHEIQLVRPHQRMDAEITRSEEHTSELQSQSNLVCRLLLE